ncbi:MAG: transposase, partial [Acidaminococcaceae bacterium]|nr:transposase [Acidaminococcaceae bacterium]
MIQKRNDLSVRRQCELLGVNRSGLYYKAKEQNDASRLLREEIMARIDYWHTKMPAIGSRKIMILLQREGYGVGRKYVQNCMRQMGITAVYPK